MEMRPLAPTAAPKEGATYKLAVDDASPDPRLDKRPVRMAGLDRARRAFELLYTKVFSARPLDRGLWFAGACAAFYDPETGRALYRQDTASPLQVWAGFLGPAHAFPTTETVAEATHGR